MFIEAVKKFIGKEVTVVFFNQKGEEETIKGNCITIDYIQRSAIISTETKEILIPRYKYLEREKIKPQE